MITTLLAGTEEQQLKANRTTTEINLFVTGRELFRPTDGQTINIEIILKLRTRI